MAVKDWSTTAASNTGIISGMSLDGSVMTVNQTDNAFRDFAAQIASQLGKLGFKGADIASSTTTNLANATGWYFHVTGTTTITGFGTVDAGQPALIRFAGALTLTHNATSLILPGGANITTAANDVAFMISEGSGNWRCISYSRASGVPLGYPTSSTDNTLVRFNGTAGAQQTSLVVVDDSGNMTIGSGAGTAAGDDNLIKPTASSAFLNIKGGSGKAKISLANEAITFYTGDSTGNFVWNTGATSSTNPGTLRMTLTQAGSLVVGGTVQGGALATEGNVSRATSGTINFRPDGNSSTTGQMTLSAAGALTLTGSFTGTTGTFSGAVSTGALTANGNSTINGTLTVTG